MPECFKVVCILCKTQHKCSTLPLCAHMVVQGLFCVFHVMTQSLADEFYQTYNDQAFNSIEPEICHLVYVANVESVLSSDVSVFFCTVIIKHFCWLM